MIFVDCPHCKEKVDIMFGKEIKNLLRKGISDCKCEYCNKVFEIYQGTEQYKTREKNI